MGLMVMFVFGAGLIAVGGAPPKNICGSYADYLYLNQSPNCWYDPDLESDIYEIIARRNIELEEYKSVTQDGYILTTFRMVHRNPIGVVFLSPPMTATATIWLARSNESLAMTFYNAGYDVWLPNNRGSFYSVDHVNMTEQQFDYWDYSIHEMGLYDLPVQLRLVKNITGRSDIVYVGYSMSTTIELIYAALYPEEAQNTLKIAILMAPSVYTKLNLKSNIQTTAWNIMKKTGIGTVSFSSSLTNWSINKLCTNKYIQILCMIMKEDGLRNLQNVDPVAATFIFKHLQNRINLKNFIHYQQIAVHKRFQYFDYGDENIKRYNSIIPPLYPIENIRVPTVFFYGGRDLTLAVQDVEKLYSSLSKSAQHGKYFYPEYNHLDFIFTYKFKEDICDRILEILKNFK